MRILRAVRRAAGVTGEPADDRGGPDAPQAIASGGLLVAFSMTSRAWTQEGGEGAGQAPASPGCRAA